MKNCIGVLINPAGSTGIPRTNSNGNNRDFTNAPSDSPESNAARGARLFCESGSMENGGEEVLHLPVIVDAAESSPAAAAAAAQQIRKFLTKEWASKPYVQYNAIMLVRILSDNPGPSFTKNFDKSFVSTVKEVLRNCKDGSTQQILRETLDNLEANKQYQEGMEALIAMWRKEKGQSASFAGQQRRAMPVVPGWNQGYAAAPDGQQRPHGLSRERSSRHNRLPAPTELASRIEEAKNSAKILMQLIQSTPSEEIVDNELLREFNERCQSAQRSMQGYINCDDPSPDDDTMLTLIETNEQLSLSSSRYQRALLTARRAMGISPSPGQEAMLSGGISTAVSSGALGGPPQQEESHSVFSPPNATPPGALHQRNLSQSNGMSAFASPVSSPGEELYQAPAGPPPPKTDRSYDQNAFALPTRNGSADDYHAPPGPPPTMLDRMNSREGAYSPPHSPPPQKSQTAGQPQSDPFADPAEYDSNPAPLAFEPGHYGTSSVISPASPSAGDRYQLPSHQNARRQSYGVPTIPEQGAYSPSQRQHDLYDSSPKVSRRPVSSIAGSEPGVSPNSPERQRRWPSQDAVSEIDGHSGVGRSQTSGSREQRGYQY